jgi:DNA polymerase-3 subunit gamma/tau
VSYTVLAVKWRPRRFDQLVGQQHVVQALVNSLEAGRLHHAYLFAGTRGVGKTTVARILAKALNCESGVVAEPCGVCDACVAIDEGRFVDLIEVDAASRTRVDDTRELLENVQYTPSRGRYKVYLIDEVHMLSNHSFNALLKTLEEPPPHVKFLFATTDPQKLPITVLSRCLQFNLKKLTVAQIQAQLERICAEEKVEAEPEALKALARAADGSLRDGLSLLDQAIAFGGGRVEARPINAMLGTIDRGHVLRILEALAAADGSALVDEAALLDERASDYGSVLDELMAALQQMAVIQLVGAKASDGEQVGLAELAARISAEDVQLYYQIALQGRRDLPVCRDQRMGFEMTLLRMLAFRPSEDDVPGAQAAGSRAAATREQRRDPRESAQQPAASQRAPKRQKPKPAVAPENAHGAAPVSAHETVEPRDVTGDWDGLLRAADIRGPARRLADYCQPASEQRGGRIELVLAEAGASYNTPAVRARLQAELGEYLGKPVAVNITPGEPPKATPAQMREAGENQRMRKAREAIEHDPHVKTMQAAFDAVLEGDSIEPVDEQERSL